MYTDMYRLSTGYKRVLGQLCHQTRTHCGYPRFVDKIVGCPSDAGDPGVRDNIEPVFVYGHQGVYAASGG